MHHSNARLVRSFYEQRAVLLHNDRPSLDIAGIHNPPESRKEPTVSIPELFREVERIADERLSIRIKGILDRSRVGDSFVHLEFERIGKASAPIRRLTDIATDLELEFNRAPILISVSGTISIDIPLPAEDRHVLTTQELYLELGGYHDGWRIPFGRYSDGDLAMFDLSQGSHALVAGSTGSGKTEFLRTIVSTIGYSCSPLEVELIIADRKGQMREFNSIPNLVQPIANTEHEFRQQLDWLSKEIEGREILATDLRDASMPKLLVVIDEIQGFEAKEGLADFLARGRSSDVIFILSTQNPHHSILPSRITCNLDTRICFRTASHSQGSMIIGGIHASKLLGSGDGLARMNGHTRRFQGALTCLSAWDYAPQPVPVALLSKTSHLIDP